MLNKKYRLLDRVKFDKSSPSPFFVLKTAKNDRPYSRFGFSVSKKTDKRATERNRIKRQVRVFVEENLEKIEPGFDILFLIKKEALGKETGDIHKNILKEFKKENLLK